MAKRSGSKHNKKSKSNKIRRNRTLRGGKDRGSPTKNPTSRASISREHFDVLVGRNIERMRRERERLAQERVRQERARLAREQRQRNNIFGSQQLPSGQTALQTLMTFQ